MRHEAKKAFARAIEIKGEEDDPSNLVTKALADLQKTVDDRLKAVEEKSAAIETKSDTTKLVDRLDKIEAKVNRPDTGKTEVVTEERKAFASYLRTGIDAMPDEERKALTVANDNSGGYLAPSEFQTEVLKNILDISPMRQAARVSGTGAGEVILPKRTGRPTGGWVGEIEARQSSESSYGQIEIPVHEMSCYVDVSLKLLEDSAVNVESEVAYDVAEEFGRLEGVAFISGNGTKKPLGIINAPNLAYTPSGNAGTLGSDPANLLITHLYSITKTYRNNGAWMMNATTLGAIRKLKDTTGAYIWQRSLAEGQPETILGRPVIEAPDMPDVGADAFPILFGDFTRAYRIFDRVGMSIFADPYSQRTNGLVRFHARRRVGGSTVLVEAVKAIKIAVS